MTPSSPVAAGPGGAAMPEFRLGWTALLAGMIGVGLCVTGLPNYAVGLFIEPLSREFGWSRSAISLWTVWQMGALACVTPVVGVLMDRFGTRPIALISIPLFSAAIAGISLLGPDIRMLYAFAVATAKDFGIFAESPQIKEYDFKPAKVKDALKAKDAKKASKKEAKKASV